MLTPVPLLVGFGFPALALVIVDGARRAGIHTGTSHGRRTIADRHATILPGAGAEVERSRRRRGMN
jgi:hypothetical protein